VANPVQTDHAIGAGWATLTLTGVTAGNSAIVAISQYVSATRTYTASSNLDGSFTSVVAYAPGRRLVLLVLHGLQAGTHTIAVAANTGTAALEAWAFECEGLDSAASPVFPTGNGFDDGANTDTHHSAPIGEIDTTEAAFIVCVGALSGSGVTTFAGSGYTKVAGSDVKAFCQWRAPLVAVTADRGQWTQTGVDRQGWSTMAAFPLLDVAVPAEPPLSYNEWVEESATSRVVLAELQPAVQLSGWTAVGVSAPNVYSIAFPLNIASDVVPGGVARRLDEVRENGVPLTAVGSVANTQAVAGRYYITTGGVLYVHTFSGGSPDAVASVVAFFSLFVATAPRDFVNGPLYEPRLVGQLPAMQAIAEDDFNAVKVFGGGTLDLVNAHRFFDRASQQYVWRNKKVTLFLGGGNMARSDYRAVGSFRIDSLTVTDELARLTVRSEASLLEQQVPFRTITRSEYPQCADDVEGSYKPVLYGAKRNIPPPLVQSFIRANPSFSDAPVGYADVYLVADPAVGPVTSIVNVRAVNRSGGQTLALPSADFAVNLSACTVTVTAPAWRSDEWSIRVDASGPTDGLGGYLDTVGEISQHLLLQLGARADQIDAASFAAADAAAPYPLALWQYEPVEAAAVIVLLQQSVLGGLAVSRAGKWQWHILDVGDEAAVGDVEPADIVAWEPVERIPTVSPLVRLYFDLDPATEGDLLQGYQMVTAEAASVRYLYEVSSGVSIRTAHVDRSSATLFAQRYRVLSSQPDTQVSVDLRGPRMMTTELFERVLVTRPRASDASGAYTQKRMQIVAIDKRLDPVRVRVTLTDLGGVGALYGGVRLVSDASVTWGTASVAQQTTLAFIGNDSGEVASGVPNPTLLW
jgi:hypothetical protein